jgi:CRP/FNR family transcriptional regulator, dissimilatory nitrate respiration regulator
MDLLTFETLPRSLQAASYTKEIVSGQRLFRQGDSTLELFIVKTGRFRLVRSTIDSNSILLQFANVGDSLGETVLFSTPYAYTAIAEVDSQVIVYPRQELITALHEYPDLAEDAIARLVRKIQALEVSLELRNIRDANQRILRYLQYLAGGEEETAIDIERPWKEIAAELGFTPNTISRALAKLEREGRISRSQNTVFIHNFTAA